MALFSVDKTKQRIWLCKAIQGFEDLTVLMGFPRHHLACVLYELEIQRIDRTYIELAWGKNMPGAYHSLSCAWEKIWQQMADLLHGGTRADPEERWWPNPSPFYQRKHMGAA